LLARLAGQSGSNARREAARAKWSPEKPSAYDDAANDRVRCPEQKFELRRGTDNAFELVCEVDV